MTSLYIRIILEEEEEAGVEGIRGIGIPCGSTSNKSGLVLYIVASRLDCFLSHQYGISINVIPKQQN